LTGWRERKTTGAGIDKRIMPILRDRAGKRFITEAAAIAAWRHADFPDFPLRGPRLLKEFFGALAAAGQTLLQHHMDFVRKSGIPEKGGVAREHHSIIETLRLLVCFDMLDPTSLASAEMLCRRMFVLEQAVGRNPKHPDYDGLDPVCGTTLSEVGAVSAPLFSAWLASVNKDEAVVMKQHRLLREERTAEAKKKPQPAAT